MRSQGDTATHTAEPLRATLIANYAEICRDFPEFTDYSPEEAADYLLQLQLAGKVRIRVFTKKSGETGCSVRLFAISGRRRES